jgi:hypothetical protein
VVASCALLVGCSHAPAGGSDGGGGGGGGGGGATVGAWTNPERVTINGWTDAAMEPFISRDGNYLFFNNSNDPSVDTNLQYAVQMDPLTFNYLAPLDGVNTTSLDAVASEDDNADFYFISTRSYAMNMATIYRGTIAVGAVTHVAVVPVLPTAAGHVIFDVVVSPDGHTLCFAEGDYSTGALTSANLYLATDATGGFARDPASDTTLAAVNLAGGTQYAPVFSKSGLELYFTRIGTDGVPTIFGAARATADAPFDAPVHLDAITGFAEAPTLSLDEKSLYYHFHDPSGTFVIYRVTR